VILVAVVKLDAIGGILDAAGSPLSLADERPVAGVAERHMATSGHGCPEVAVGARAARCVSDRPALGRCGLAAPQPDGRSTRVAVDASGGDVSREQLLELLA
jgi:hypothetical protein